MIRRTQWKRVHTYLYTAQVHGLACEATYSPFSQWTARVRLGSKAAEWTSERGRLASADVAMRAAERFAAKHGRAPARGEAAHG